MKKWQELAFMSFLNLAVTLIIGSLLNAFYVKGDIILTITLISIGVVVMIASIFGAREIERKKK